MLSEAYHTQIIIALTVFMKLCVMKITSFILLPSVKNPHDMDFVHEYNCITIQDGIKNSRTYSINNFKLILFTINFHSFVIRYMATLLESLFSVARQVSTCDSVSISCTISNITPWTWFSFLEIKKDLVKRLNLMNIEDTGWSASCRWHIISCQNCCVFRSLGTNLANFASQRYAIFKSLVQMNLIDFI